MGYNNAPSLAYWWLDGFFDFDGPQSTRLRNDLTALQDWHRKEELPALATTLKDLQAAATQDVSAAQVCQLASYLEERVQVVIDRAVPTAVALGPLLSSAQLDHFARAMDKRNREWREEWLDGTPAERMERRMKKLVDRAETFYGRLTDAQRQQLLNQLEQSAFDPALQYREFLRRQQDAFQTLRGLRSGTASEIHVQAELRALIARNVQTTDPQFRQYTERVRTQACESIAAFHNRTSPAQRARLQNTLAGYEADARALLNR